MPNKDPTDRHSNSSVLQKARSFKADLKSRIIRRTPSITRSGSQSPRTSRKRHSGGLQRGNSFNEGHSKADRLAKAAESDVEKLGTVNKEVQKALGYLQDVVDKNIMALLAGSVTVVLETIMELCQLIGNYTQNTDSTILASQYGEVNQSLAALIRWSDNVILQEPMKANKQQGSEAVTAVKVATEKLISLAVEKLENKAGGEKGKGGKGDRNSKNSPNTLPLPDPQEKRSSLPDIPLTPREKKILAETTFSFEDDVDAASPPPKPPLPKSFELDKKHRIFTDEVFSPSTDPSTPPPLPRKERQSSIASVYDNCTVTSPTPRLSSSSSQAEQTMTSGETTPVNHHSPRHLGPVPIIHTPSSLSPTSPRDSLSSTEDVNVVGNDPTGFTSALKSSYQSYTAARLSHYDNMQAKSIQQFTQQMKQLTNSASVAGAASALTMRTGEDSRNPNSISLSLDLAPSSSSSGKPPPLPDKKHDSSSSQSPTSILALSPRLRESRRERQIVPSQYDNVLASLRNEPLVVPHRTTIPEDGVRTSHSAMSFSSSTSTSAAFSSTTTQQQQLGSNRRVTFQQQQQQQQVQQHQQQLVSNDGMMTSVFQQQAAARRCHMSSSVSANAILSTIDDNSTPPPLPEKKGKIDQYLAVTFGEYTGPAPVDNFMSRLSVTYYQSQFFQHQMELFHPLYPRSTTLSRMSDVSSRSSDVFSVTSASSEDSSGVATGSSGGSNNTPAIMPALPAKQGGSSSSTGGGGVVVGGGSSSSSGMSDLSSMTDETAPGPAPAPVHQQPDIVRCSTTPDKDGEVNLLDALDVSEHLVKKVANDKSWEVRGGCVDALLVHATAAGTSSSGGGGTAGGRAASFLYQEAFLTTYRTFVSPATLLDKLLYRYRTFSRAPDTRRKKLSRNAFSLLIRVVDELCMDVGEEVLQLLLELVLELVQDGELMLARILRRKGLEKIEAHKQHRQHHITLLSSYQLSSKQYKITDFKSEHIAEQMTLLDAILFLKIEIPEVLLWAKEQNEEQSPNLTEFTEHFNKMSYWCRTQVLQQEESRDREKVLIKFIKIMKHLRRLNNFNSYLAILSALDSAPLRRLEWQKQNLEALKEFCQLIDSSSSFRAYRQALADTEPPCIPYIGLILQDLTFVHIGNPDFLPEGKHVINFAKRWQQFHILDNMRRFKKCKYPFKKNQKIITFFNNFDDCLSEESLWQISENIKPRNTKKKPIQPQQ